MFGSMDEQVETGIPSRAPPKQKAWEMRDVIALFTLQKLQELHGTREEMVENAGDDADAAYEIANQHLKVRSQRKDAYHDARRARQGVER